MRAITKDIALIALAILFAMSVRAYAQQGPDELGPNLYQITVTQSIEGQPVHRFIFYYTTYEQCYMNAMAIKKHYGLTWTPQCKPTKPTPREEGI